MIVEAIIKGERVVVRGIGIGSIINIRLDNNNRKIYTVKLDDVSITPDGLFYARYNELSRAPK